MAKQEAQPSPEKKGRIARFLKGFNKISAAVFIGAGLVFDNPLFFGLAAIDVAQVLLIGQYEKWRDRRKAAAKPVGQAALQAA